MQGFGDRPAICDSRRVRASSRCIKKSQIFLIEKPGSSPYCEGTLTETSQVLHAVMSRSRHFGRSQSGCSGPDLSGRSLWIVHRLAVPWPDGKTVVRRHGCVAVRQLLSPIMQRRCLARRSDVSPPGRTDDGVRRTRSCHSNSRPVCQSAARTCHLISGDTRCRAVAHSTHVQTNQTGI